MATPVNRLGCFALRYSSRTPLRRRCFLPTATFRNLHKTSIPAKDAPKDAPRNTRQDISEPYVFDVSSMGPEERNEYDYLSPEEKLQYEEESRKFYEHMESPRVQSGLATEAANAAFEVSEEIDPEEDRPHPFKPGLMAMGEDDEEGTGADDDFQGDDITSLGHGELEQHREMREYARIAAWEMPLLSKHAKPFEPPGPDQPFRFRYTTYMGETHPAEKKIVVEFCTSDLPGLTEPQRIKLIKLVGARYNPEKDLVKMSCEMFETQAENKRYLGDLVKTLMTEARNESDMFEDVPLDFRHHKYKTKLVFPASWKMTPENQDKLELERQKNLSLRQIKGQHGQIVDGAAIIQDWVRRSGLNEAPQTPIDSRKGIGPKVGPRGLRTRRLK